MKYYLVSLGCPKNTVDAEDMVLLLNAAGHVQVDDPAQADLLLVNTCGFIERARAESVQALNDLALRKGSAQRLVATGCLSQRDGAALARQVPGLDGILGTRRWAEVVSLADQRPGSNVGSARMAGQLNSRSQGGRAGGRRRQRRLLFWRWSEIRRPRRAL